MDKWQAKRFEIIDWAMNRGWFINPSKGMEVYIGNIMKFGHCPCDSSRPNCPCLESEAEVANKGHCLCRLYWANYQAFRNTLRPLKGEESEGRTTKEIKESDSGGTKKRSRRRTSQ